MANPVSTRLDGETEQALQEYADQRGISRSKALAELADAGLRISGDDGPDIEATTDIKRLLGLQEEQEQLAAQIAQKTTAQKQQVERLMADHFDLADVDRAQLEAFADQPYKIVPKGESEYYVVAPRFVPFSVGHLLDQDDAWNVFVINKYVGWIEEIPEGIRDKIDLDRRYDRAVVQDGMLELEDEDERDRAWDDLGGQQGGLYRREGDTRIKIKSGREFDVIADLVDKGNLPFAAKSIADEDLRGEPDGVSLRPYQDRAWEQFAKYGQVGVYWPPGLGKTFFGLYAGERIAGKKLVVVPSSTLESQWKERIKEHCEWTHKWEVRTYQYLTTNDNMSEYTGVNAPKLTIFDECVAGDTEVAVPGGGSKKIEDISVGDEVLSFNEETGVVEAKKVTNKWDKGVRDVVDVAGVTCTPDHEFYTENGYTGAHELLNQNVYALPKRIDEHGVQVLRRGDRRPAVQDGEPCESGAQGRNEAGGRGARVRCLRPGLRGPLISTPTPAGSPRHGPRVQVSGVRGEVREQESTRGAYGVGPRAGARVPLHLRAGGGDVGGAVGGRDRSDVLGRPRDGESPGLERWCSPRDATEDSRRGAGEAHLYDGLRYLRWDRYGEGQSAALSPPQGRRQHEQRPGKSGRPLPSVPPSRPQPGRPTDASDAQTGGTGGVGGRPLNRVRVRDVEPAGVARVYDIEVEDNHNFFANGVLVSNCHTLPATTFSKLATLDTTYRIGLSATPYREDERTDYIFALTGVPVGIQWEELLQYGDYSFPEVSVYLYRTERQKRADLTQIVKEGTGKSLVFCDGIDAGTRLSEELDVPFVHGETPKADRMDIFRDNRVVIGSRVADEGLSLDDLDRVIEYQFHGGSRRQELQRAGRVMHSGGVGQHIVQMTDDEYEKYGRRLYSLEEKGMDIRLERRGA